MSARKLDVVFLGLSITSSWGNGHATTYRGLVRELVARGHRVLFLEWDAPWYRAHRDLARPPWGEVELYDDLVELKERFAERVARADVVVVGSYVKDGVEVLSWVLGKARGVVGFYDIDTPVTLAKLAAGDHEYIEPSLIPRLDLYLSFTGGPVLRQIESELGARAARALYCSVDPSLYFPVEREPSWDLGYLGTYSADRQPGLERLLLEPARRRRERRFVVAGPQYPDAIDWPDNVARIDHVPPGEHRAFYGEQVFTLNVTRKDMVRAGYSPSVRLFEAAACGTPVLSDRWPGIETIFVPGEEILLVDRTEDVLEALRATSPEEAREIGERARRRALCEHTAAHRAAELEEHLLEAMDARARRKRRPPRAFRSSAA